MEDYEDEEGNWDFATLDAIDKVQVGLRSGLAVLTTALEAALSLSDSEDLGEEPVAAELRALARGLATTVVRVKALRKRAGLRRLLVSTERARLMAAEFVGTVEVKRRDEE